MDWSEARHVSGHDFSRAEQPSGCVLAAKSIWAFSPAALSVEMLESINVENRFR